jgi:hypothetical protein
MELLHFRDAEGQEWEVWEVGARLPIADRVSAKPTPRWLCFASGSEVRRLATYPPHWHTLRPSDLAALLARATPARQVPPLNTPHRAKDADVRDR